MKKIKKLYKFLATLLVLALLCNCFAVIGYASEFESKTTLEAEQPNLAVPQESIENHDNQSNVVTTNEQESYPNGFIKADISDGIYYIKNIGTGQYIDIHGPNTDKIHQWRYHTDIQEYWEITKQSDDYYVIKSLMNNKYIGIENTNIGIDNINLYTSISNQTKWSIVKNASNQYAFVPYNNISYMLYAPSTVTGVELQLTNVIQNNNYDKWILIEQLQNDSTNLIQNIETRRFLSPYGPYTDEGRTIHNWDFFYGTATKWIFERQSDFSYTIKNEFSQKYLGTDEDENGTIYIKQFSTVENRTKWKIHLSSSGHWTITPKNYEPYSYTISVDPLDNNVGGILKLVEYTNNSNYKDEWQLIESHPYLGSLTTTWHSSDVNVGYWDLDGTSKNLNVYVRKLNESTGSFYFLTNTEDAIEQWQTLLSINFNEVYNKDSANIKVYGGTRAQIEEQSGYENTTWSGVCSAASNIQGIMNINGGNEIVVIREITSSHVYIISNTNANALLKTITHELGHALGYSGHAPNPTDVMYAYSHESYTLKTLESNHIKAIYLLFNK